MEAQIKRSKQKDEKFEAIIAGKMASSFGAKGMSDYTRHKDAERKERYIARHGKNENWSDPKTAGFYAKNVLWNKTSLKASVADINKKFQKLNVKLKL